MLGRLFVEKHSNDLEIGLRFKKEIEKDFEDLYGIKGRDFYSAFYSIPQKSPLLWINLNPGGTPDDYKILSDDQLAQGRHEFWHGDGKTSKATGQFLQRLFGVPQRKLRSIQGTNVAWERSKKGSDINLVQAAKRAAPLLNRYLQFVQPSVLMFGGAEAFRLFVESQGATISATHETLMGNWGTSQARIFVSSSLVVPGVGSVDAIMVSHPSRGVRAGVLERCQAALGNLALPDAVA